MNVPQEKVPRKYTEKEEMTLEENLTPEQRIVVCRVFKSVSAKGISNSRHNKRIEFVEYLESFINRVAWLALTQREKEKLR
ncbi:hypothetical protein ACK86P_004085 [Salmonella enterica]|nr:hypothetical protein [Salmonella enterica]EJJ4154270.1 hypothetical protein [Salmonella enterica]EJJ4360859.1 hypothetical protein [Salmonella enterica]ELK9346898.1 hypothetical protein [Salmonella enterica]ELK9374031.1 hypothetical protein [Salmonella enterica]